MNHVELILRSDTLTYPINLVKRLCCAAGNALVKMSAIISSVGHHLRLKSFLSRYCRTDSS